MPDNELVPCLLWEYLRESQTARQLAREWRELFTAADAAKRDQAPLAIRTQSLPVKINHELRIPDFMYCAVAIVSGFHGLSGVSWRSLTPNAKRFLREPCESINPPAFIGLEMHARVLAEDATRRFNEELARTPSTTGPVSLEELRKQPPLRIPEARATLNYFKQPDSHYEAFCVVVDWKRYDNSAIKTALNDLTKKILASRPAGVEPQIRSGWTKRNEGENSEWRGKLQSLGRARLHWRCDGVPHLRHAYSDAYAWLANNLGADKGNRAIGKSLSDGAARFKEAFWEILPFEKGNKPLSRAAVPPHRRIS